MDTNTARRYADAGRFNAPVPMRRLLARGDRCIHPASVERALVDLQSPDSGEDASTN
ncbi:hypothetical protein HC031_14235 [Planosporangium thailandense]|uniref:Uncharacterized protein n=1 Tax=Planosporangium thailandense TaxID=765197 RepID=A0ABX0XY98_9ACTN|nr:hypothetical protein [Planosporangium thailandense]NJC70867.1 hypothetical protein [Planosporangium thailandense]